MKFWDTSAIVPLCLDEPATRSARALIDEDPSIVVWWLTRTEVRSAIARRRREGSLAPRGATYAVRQVELLAANWSEIAPTDVVRERAERLLSVHVLRAADALQIAAALLWSRGRTREHSVVSLDTRLREAAEVEGFQVLPAEM